MRRFDLKEYLDGPDMKVVTRDGREVRILCTDKKSHDNSDYSVVALIPIRLGGEEIFTYNAKGEREGGSDYDEDSLGLFFTPDDDGLKQSWGGASGFLQPSIRQRGRQVGKEMLR